MKRILLIENNQDLLDLERDYLEANGFDVAMCADGKNGLAMALSEEFHLILLNSTLPYLDGFHVCRQLREKKDIPIVFVSDKCEDIHKIRAFGLGADDYMSTPFSPYELVARVKAHINRYERLTKRLPASDVLCHNDLEIQVQKHRVYERGREIALTNLEFELLVFFAKNPGLVFSRERLFDRVWGQDAIGDTATVMVHVNRLREKIEPNPSKPMYIETVWGAGYRFAE